MIRIWHQSFTDLSTMPLYGATLETHARRVMPDDVEVVPHGLQPGTYGVGTAPIDAIRYPYLEFLNEQQICEAARTAERDGFDAIAIGCFFDPALRVVRSLVDLPVVSLAESCLLTACSLGRAAGIVTLCGDESENLLDLAQSYGLAQRTAAIVGLDPAIDEFDLEADRSRTAEILASFERASERVVRSGADVLIPGDGVLNEFLVRNGCTNVDQVPVMDSIAVLFHHAAMLVRLRRSTGLSVSRHHYYARPPLAMVTSARAFARVTEVCAAGFSTAPDGSASTVIGSTR